MVESAFGQFLVNSFFVIMASGGVLFALAIIGAIICALYERPKVYCEDCNNRSVVPVFRSMKEDYFCMATPKKKKYWSRGTPIRKPQILSSVEWPKCSKKNKRNHCRDYTTKAVIIGGK